MRALKKTISCIMIICIFIMPFGVRQVSAEAIPVPTEEYEIFKVIEGSKDAQGVIQSYGPTLGYMLLVLLGLYYVGDTTVAAYTDIQNPTSDFYNQMENEVKPFIQDWWFDFKTSFVWIYDESVNLAEYIAYGNIIEDFSEWIIPVKENTEPIQISIDLNLSDYIQDYIVDYTGMEGARVGTYDMAYSYWIKALKENTNHDLSKITITADEFKINEGYEKNFYVISRVPQIPYLIISNPNNDPYYTDNTHLYIYKSGTTNNYDDVSLYPEGTIDLYRFTNLGDYVHTTLNPVYSNIIIRLFDGADNKVTIDNEEKFLENIVPTIIYSSKTLRAYRDRSPYIEATLNMERHTVAYNKSDFEMLSSTGANKITITQDLVNVGMDKVISNNTTTDEVISIINDADVVGRLNNVAVIENPVIQVDNPNVIEDYGWLQGLFDGLKNLFRWLFVASDAVFEDAISQCKTKMEHQAGLLTYPLTLVIQFLMQVEQLDSSQDFIFELPEIKYKNNILYEGGSFNINHFIRENNLVYIQNIIFTIGNFIMVIGMLNMAWKKGEEIIRGN